MRLNRTCNLFALLAHLLTVVPAWSMATASAPTGTPQALDSLPSFGQAITQMLFALVVILAIAVVLLRWVLPGLAPSLRTSGQTIEILESRRLEPRKTVYLVRVAGDYLLVGCSESRIELLAHTGLARDRIDEVLRQANDTGTSNGKQFARLLQRRRGESTRL